MRTTLTSLVLLAAFAVEAQTKFTANNISTAAPPAGSVALGAGSPAAGTALTMMRSDATLTVTGTLPETRGGTGAGTLSCGGVNPTALSSNGSSYACTLIPLTTFSLQGTLPESLGGTGAGPITCTSQFVTSDGSSYSCVTATLASAQFANQGTTSQVLIGNAAGNPSWGVLPANANNVQTNATLTGSGTSGSVLGINLANANTWTAQQTFSSATANQTSAVFNGNGTGNGANFVGGAAGASGTGTNAYGINVTGGSASGGGIPGPGINVTGGTGAAIGAPGIVTTGSASAGTNQNGAQGAFSTGGAASGNAAGTTGGSGGTAYAGNGGVGGATATGIGGAGGDFSNGTGGVGGAASGAGTGGNGGRGGVYVGGASGGGATNGGTGGSGVAATGGAGVATNGSGGDGLLVVGGAAVGTGNRGDAINATSGQNGSGTTRGYVIRMNQANTIMAHTNKNPLSADPSSLFNGDEWISGATTAMTPKVRLNGVTQPLLSRGANGLSSVQAFRAGSVCTTAASVGATCGTTVTLPVAYPDANYTAVCVGLAGTNVPVPSGVSSVTASTFAFSIVAITAAAATFASLECVTIHD
jgi:hypothetical protein